jgi:hypothetical protein
VLSAAHQYSLKYRHLHPGEHLEGLQSRSDDLRFSSTTPLHKLQSDSSSATKYTAMRRKLFSLIHSETNDHENHLCVSSAPPTGDVCKGENNISPLARNIGSPQRIPRRFHCGTTGVKTKVGRTPRARGLRHTAEEAIYACAAATESLKAFALFPIYSTSTCSYPLQNLSSPFTYMACVCSVSGRDYVV